VVTNVSDEYTASIFRVENGTNTFLLSAGCIKKRTTYGIENIYLLYIFHPELHTLMTSLF
jgi:hypothetical protein